MKRASSLPLRTMRRLPARSRDQDLARRQELDGAGRGEALWRRPTPSACAVPSSRTRTARRPSWAGSRPAHADHPGCRAPRGCGGPGRRCLQCRRCVHGPSGPSSIGAASQPPRLGGGREEGDHIRPLLLVQRARLDCHQPVFRQRRVNAIAAERVEHVDVRRRLVIAVVTDAAGPVVDGLPRELARVQSHGRGRCCCCPAPRRRLQQPASRWLEQWTCTRPARVRTRQQGRQTLHGCPQGFDDAERLQHRSRNRARSHAALRQKWRSVRQKRTGPLFEGPRIPASGSCRGRFGDYLRIILKSTPNIRGGA